jgi:outer membrane protein assembly factor BamB
MLALHLNNGQLLWRTKVSGHIKRLRDGVLYVEITAQGDHGTFLAFKAKDGSLLWQRNDIDFAPDAPLQAQNGVVYVMLTDNKTIMALNANDGTTLARYSADAL